MEKRLQAGALIVVGAFLLFGPYLLFNRWLAGAWWPNTFFAKQVEYAANRDQDLLLRLAQQYAQPLVGVGVILLPGFVYKLYLAIKRKAWGIVLGPVWLLGHLTLYAIRLPVTYQHGRYVMPGMVVFFLWGVAGMILLVNLQADGFWCRVLSRTWILTGGLVLLGFYVLGARAYARDVAFIETEMVGTAFWLAENTDEDALIASHDIGALGYFAQRPILDLAGLVSPDVIPIIRDEQKLAAYIKAQNADYLVTFPSWYMELPKYGTLVFAADGRFSQAFGGEHMHVYRINISP
jgi:hypothetical protein